ncbi:MAG: hypothetical protein PUB87_01065 [Eubacteriaceae bacterium]|nr:hypothetical protein [Eubacteriaceae bacterium]
MNRDKLLGIFFFLCALVFYVFAFINLFKDHRIGNGLMWVATGTVWICMGSMFYNR